MTQEFVLNLAQEALTTALLLAAPVLGLSLLVGITISLLQATTQIQEQTLTFIPKIVAVIAGVLLMGRWMLNTLLEFTTEIFQMVGTVVR
ncbi:MAG TPA: flagellar biosynthesis protein FliQ [Firmicutes bacterium]|nr:flagellar biosynthesis protein FliQ [Bacillota bacterium]